MPEIGELVERLRQELGVEKIEWNDNSRSFPHFETDDKEYFLADNSIFEVNKETNEVACYNCKSKVMLRMKVVNTKGIARNERDYWCPTCKPKPQEDLSYLNFSKTKTGFPF